MQARRIRPRTGHTDRRRLTAAGLSAVVPGLGQAFNQRRRLALWMLVPTLIAVAIVLLALATQSPARLAAQAVAPSVLSALLTLNLLFLVWRLFSVGQAFLDTRWHGPTGRLGVIGILLIALAVAAPHAVAWRYGTVAGEAFAKVFSGQVLSAVGGDDKGDPRPTPSTRDRINVLLVGVDTTRKRTETLTDTMMVVSLDPVGNTISMVSIPRDLVNVPLGTGDEYGPKLNSLYSFAERNPDIFPQGGMRALQDAVGALLQIPITYYARIDFTGFVEMVDAVGGVDIKVRKALSDPNYDGYHLGHRGFSVTKGLHHFSGAEALAFARIRKPAGESDFTRADRQQQILVALKDQAADGGSLFFELPALLEAVGNTIRTDVPVERLPELAAIMDDVTRDITRAVINHPLVDSINGRYGSSLDPNLKAVRAMSAALFPEPGGTPVPWPTPKPTATPDPTKPPKATATP